MLLHAIPLRETTAGLILGLLIRSSRWPLAAIAVGFLLCGALAFMTGDRVLFQAGLWLLAHALCLFCSFVVHEISHVVCMRRFSGVTHIVVSTNSRRFSITPIGSLRGWQIAVTAVAGPGASCAVGAALVFLIPNSLLHLWFLFHAVFILPVFGDGRGLIEGIKYWSRPVALTAHARS